MISVSTLVNNNEYDTEEWGYYFEYNEYRSSLLDYPMPEYTEYEREYNILEIDETDYDLLKSCSYSDFDKFSLDKLKQLTELQESTPLGNKRISLD